MNAFKKFKLSTTVIVLTVIVSSGCSDMLDAEDDGRTSYEVIFANRSKIQAVYNDCRNDITGPNLTSVSFCDEGISSAYYTDAGVRNWYAGLIQTSNHGINPFGGDPWGGTYNIIRKANIFLDHIEGQTANLTEEQVAGMKAEILGYRAYYYWVLAKRYGGVPVLTEALPADYDFSVDKRPSFIDVVKQIITDSEEALKGPDLLMGFPWEYTSRLEGHITPAVCHAIMSEAATYAVSPLWYDAGAFTYEDATRITGRALYECLNHGYELFLGGEDMDDDEIPDVDPDMAQNAYALYFITHDNTRTTDKETIFRVSGRLGMWQGNGLPSTAGQTSAGNCPSQNIIDMYEMQATGMAPITGYTDPEKLSPIIDYASGYDATKPYEGRDPRFEASIYYNGAVRNLNAPNGTKVETYVGGREGIREGDVRYSPTGYYLRKYNYWDSRQGNSSDGSMRMFRLAELYLNFAETANRSHGPEVQIAVGPELALSAIEAVNAVRARAGMPDFPSGMSADEFEAKLRNERTIELAFEGHRAFDVRRWKIIEQTDGHITGMSIVGSGATPVYNRFAFDERKCNDPKYMIFPIPLSEVRKILYQTGDNWQNPGWEY